MTVPVMVSEHDLLGLLSIVSDHRADDPGDGLPLSLFEHLMQQVPCDEISFFGLDSQQQAMWFGQGIPATGNGDMDAFWTHFWDSLPCSYPERSGDLRSVTCVSDFYSARQWRATGMYCDYLRPAGWTCPKAPYASTWRTSTQDFRCPAARPPSPVPFRGRQSRRRPDAGA
jgi:hypothetical protein